jgi:hypothetical protein
MARERLVEIVNRTTEPLDVMFDGCPDVVRPGYKVIEVEGEGPKIVGAGHDGAPATHVCGIHAAEAYKRQHPRMGTQDPHSVDANDTEYLIGVEAWGDDIEATEQTGSDELIDRLQLPEQRRNATVVPIGTNESPRSTRSKKQAKEARKAASKKKANAQHNRRQKYTDEKLKAPTGMKTNYND